MRKSALVRLLPIIAGSLACFDKSTARNDIEGRWEGTATAFGATAPLTIDFTRRGDSVSATTSMTAEAMYVDRPLANVVIRPPGVHFEFPDRHGRPGVFDGTRRADTITGHIRKGRNTVSLRLLRTSRMVPQPPYNRERVRFKGADGLSMEGTLFLPKRGGRHALVVFIHGSGPSTREDFNFLADRFARGGIAAFAYDKRGSDASSRASPASNYATLARDAMAAIVTLRLRSDIDSRATGILGSSEGGWVAPIVASQDSRVAFLIALVAPGDTYAENGIYQNLQRLRAINASQSDAAHYRRLISELNELARIPDTALSSSANRERAKALQLAIDSAQRFSWSDAVDLPKNIPTGEQRKRLRWQMVHFDPIPYWRQVRVPVMVVLGGSDQHVDSRRSKLLIAAALAGRRATFVEYPAAQHDLMIMPSPGEPFAFPHPPPGYPDTLVRWVSGTLAGLR
ncbi:MAG TPA: alpha/beta fold hydrolase [Gemmatimonadaceae bacterium]|nr:alpha/beta fold hydrolase [Gemmatimonadaceae bacterium]